ncbi:MAG: UDP-N-acetylglucosamine 2-epimerase (non-hydrolyzing) [Acidobacteria bacterium]|nr:UDP-N-acetylglucosamine 2-epimerase (non-hydrolyzing) [Acidobacteriota bacterium]
MKVAMILGTRPEIIKFSPVIRELQNEPIDLFIIHTGQHYSYEMDQIFFEQLKLPSPDYNLDVGSGTHAIQTAKMLSGIEPILESERPDVVLVEGDTNTVLAGALAAVKLAIPVGHIEAGLRSYDRRMPEEMNRILTDHMSAFLFAPTGIAVKNLEEEGIGSKLFLTSDGMGKATIHNVGNTIVDATLQNIRLAQEKERSILEQCAVAPKEYVLLTAHRSENVDNIEFLRHLCQLLDYINDTYKLKVIWPIHPRTVKKLSEFGIAPRARLIDPQGYLEFLALESNARIVVTDSGGVQEEMCVLGIPCVTIRKTTERPETVLVGANEVAGTEFETMRGAFDKMSQNDRTWRIPYAQDTSKTIIRILGQALNQGLSSRNFLFLEPSCIPDTLVQSTNGSIEEVGQTLTCFPSDLWRQPTE